MIKKELLQCPMRVWPLAKFFTISLAMIFCELLTSCVWSCLWLRNICFQKGLLLGWTSDYILSYTPFSNNLGLTNTHTKNTRSLINKLSQYKNDLSLFMGDAFNVIHISDKIWNLGELGTNHLIPFCMRS